jgi:hypothetical protein
MNLETLYTKKFALIVRWIIGPIGLISHGRNKRYPSGLLWMSVCSLSKYFLDVQGWIHHDDDAPSRVSGVFLATPLFVNKREQ